MTRRPLEHLAAAASLLLASHAGEIRRCNNLDPTSTAYRTYCEDPR